MGYTALTQQNWRCRRIHAGFHVWKPDETQSKFTEVQTQTITLHHSSVKLLVRAGLRSGLHNLKGLFQLNNYTVLQWLSLHQPKAAITTLLLTAQAPRQFLLCSINSLTNKVISLYFSIKCSSGCKRCKQSLKYVVILNNKKLHVTETALIKSLHTVEAKSSHLGILQLKGHLSVS